MWGRRSGWALAILLAGVSAGLLQSSSSSGDDERRFSPHEALLRIVGTKETDIDLDGDERPDVIRRYDKSGALVYSQSTDTMNGEAFRQVYSLKREPHKDRQILETTWSPVGSEEVVRKQVDLLSSKGVLYRRELQWKTALGKAFDRMHVQVPKDGFLAGEFMHFDPSKKRWVLKNRTRAPLIYIAQSEARIRAAASERTDNYITCRLLAGDTPTFVMPAEGAQTFEQWESECRTHIAGLSDVVAQMEEFDLPSVMPPACNGVTQYFLSSGFTVDMISCTSSAAGIRNPDADSAIRRIKNATETVVGGMLSCLNELNPTYARQFAMSIARKRPVIRCGGNHGAPGSAGTTMSDIVRDDVCRRTDRTCRGYFARNSGVAAAFFEDRPGELFLLGVDPNSELESTVPEATETQRTNALASTIFHEMMHSCGHMGGSGHNHPSHPHQDDVYGCQGACGYVAEDGGAPVDIDHLFQVSRESCMRCAQANGNTPSEAARSRCDRLPSEESVTDGYKAYSRVKDAQLCLLRERAGALGNQACARLRSDPVARQACGPNPNPATAPCLNAIIAAGADDLRELMEHDEMGARLRNFRETCRGANGQIGMAATGRAGCVGAEIIFTRILGMTDQDD